MRLLPLLPLLLLTAPGAAEALRLSGTQRTRAEAVGGQVRPGFVQDEAFLALRTTLRAELGDGPVRLVAELWDSRVHGAVSGSVLSTTDVNALEPVQLHVEAELGAARLTAGRMMLNLGSRRLVAADDYRNTTNGYTGLRLDLGDAARAQTTLIAVMPQQRRPEDFADLVRNRVVLDHEGLDQILVGGVGSAPVAAATRVELSLIGFRERDRADQPTRDRRLVTLGARLLKTPGPGRIDGEVEVFWQLGSTRTGLSAAAPRVPVDAGFLHADLGYRWPGAAEFRLSAEFDHATGDGPGRRFRRFDTLFGMRRAELGPAGLYNVIGRTNISTIGLRGEGRAGRRTTAMMTARALWAASATDSFSTTGVRDPSGQSGRFAGYQAEGRIGHAILPGRVQAELNGALLLRRGLLRTAPNAPPGRAMRYLTVGVSTAF